MLSDLEVCVELLMEYRGFGIFIKEQEQWQNGNLLGKSHYLNSGLMILCNSFPRVQVKNPGPTF